MSEIFKENEYEIDKILIKICYCFVAFYQLLFVSTLSFKINLILVIVGVIISLIPILYYNMYQYSSNFKSYLHLYSDKNCKYMHVFLEIVNLNDEII